MEPTQETWRPVVGYEGYYEVSDQGRVRSLARVILRADGLTASYRQRIMTASAHPEGYRTVTLCRDCVSWSVGIHKLVLPAFIGPRPPGMVCRHLDGDPANNMLSNLVWGTQSENTRDRVRHGRDPQASKTHCKRGHPFDEVNTYVSSRGHRHCRACQEQNRQRYLAKQKEGAL